MRKVFPKHPDWVWMRLQYRNTSLLFDNVQVQTVADRCKGRLAYLATPYSREVVSSGGAFMPERSAEMERYASCWVAHFACAGLTVTSPIVGAVMMMDTHAGFEIDPLDQKFWTNWCRPMLEACGSVVIPPIDGWDRSVGVWQEACWALSHNCPVFLVSGDGLLFDDRLEPLKHLARAV